MHLFEKEFKINKPNYNEGQFKYLSDTVKENLRPNEIPVRFVVTQSDFDQYHCELGVLAEFDNKYEFHRGSILDFRKRNVENTSNFNCVLLVPTGIGAEIGGHAGDAAPVAKLLAGSCDNLITHPNVVNASDINEMPENGLYVEGSVISRLLMGTVGLQPTRANRVLVVIDNHDDEVFVNAAINSVGGARAAYGLNCPKVVQLTPPVKLKGRYTSTGRAAGRVEALSGLIDVLQDLRNDYDAVAISSVIDVPYSYHLDYFISEGEIINPWGGVEAMLTHAISELYNIPSAHSPMFESEQIANLDTGVVDPRMAAEAVSMTFLQCTLKGLQRSPKIITEQTSFSANGVISASDISCLVIPDGCLGLPTLAALEQGVPVIAVRENKNIMKNDLTQLPWSSGQFHVVENYWEAAGVMLAIKSGITPDSVRRPLARTPVELRSSTILEKTRNIL